MASRCTEQAVQEFLMERGGRVQQMELIDHFLSIRGGNDQSEEGVDLEVLTRIVDSVGFIKVENGVKFVLLNAGGSAESVMPTDTDGHDHAECNGNVNVNIQETLDDNSCVNGNPDNGNQTGNVTDTQMCLFACNCATMHFDAFIFRCLFCFVLFYFI